MELGSMPSPIAISNSISVAKSGADESDERGFDVDPSDPWPRSGYRPDRPFLANLAVSKKYRRQGIGKTLVKLALKISKNKWSSSSLSSSDVVEDEKKKVTLWKGEDDANVDSFPDDTSSSSSWWMYLSVDKDNEAATRLYDSLDFSIVLDETQVLSPQRLERLSRPPRLYYGKQL
jgi:GNAT superfamily N-acetyltransferase